MVLSTQNITYAVNYGALPVANGAINMGVIALGHAFSLASRTGLLHGGLFGIIQAIAARTLFDNIKYIVEDKLKLNVPDAWAPPLIFGSLFAAVAISGTALFAISALAVEAGLITSTISLSTLTILSLANFVLSIGNIFVGHLLME